jgi:hypothetical protein
VRGVGFLKRFQLNRARLVATPGALPALRLTAVAARPRGRSDLSGLSGDPSANLFANMYACDSPLPIQHTLSMLLNHKTSGCSALTLCSTCSPASKPLCGLPFEGERNDQHGLNSVCSSSIDTEIAYAKMSPVFFAILQNLAPRCDEQATTSWQ